MKRVVQPQKDSCAIELSTKAFNVLILPSFRPCMLHPKQFAMVEFLHNIMTNDTWDKCGVFVIDLLTIHNPVQHFELRPDH
jgi:hypothetical protein